MSEKKESKVPSPTPDVKIRSIKLDDAIPVGDTSHEFAWAGQKSCESIEFMGPFWIRVKSKGRDILVPAANVRYLDIG